MGLFTPAWMTKNSARVEKAVNLLLRLLLRTLRGFLAAIGLTVHVPACFSSVQAGKDERCPHLYRYARGPWR